MTLTQLSYVLAVAKYRHFASAAESCFVTQPTLSMQIQKLEEELGVEIFNRSKLPVTPTALGERIIAQAQITLEEANRLLAIVNSEKNEVKGPIRLAVIPTVAPYLLPLFIPSFTHSYPAAELIIDELQTEQIITQLADRKIDLGLLVTPLHDRKILEKPLFFEPFLAYLHPKHPLTRKEKIRESDLSMTDVWLLKEGHCFRDQVLNLCKDTSNTHSCPLPNLHFASGSLETIKRLVDTGKGSTLLPYLATQELSAKTKKLQIREFHKPVPSREVSLVYGRNFTKVAALNALVDCICRQLPTELVHAKASQFRRIEILPNRTVNL
jgi:LysR family transcriptional regulator, hydrogen peroxide-inducible genes activator